MPQFGLTYSGPARRDFDFYQTQQTLIDAFIDVYKKRLDNIAHRFIIENKTLNILDPAGGDGRWGASFKNYFKFNYPNLRTILTGVEIQEFEKPHIYDNWFQGDMTTMTLQTDYDLIVTNPPYGPTVVYNDEKMALAEVFVRRSWAILRPQGHMIMLLNNDFETGVNRMKGLWSTIYPVEKLACSRRPRFYGTGTSGNNYGIFIWVKGKNGYPEGIARQWVTKLFIHDHEDRND